MQLSAASLLLAAQHSTGPGRAVTASPEAKAFAPLDFRRTAKPAPVATPQAAPDSRLRPGAAIDIRV